jgi:REP element-mobilizing transposase RayT
MSPRWEPNPDIRRGRTVVYTLHAHLVFTPKYRRKVFDDAMLTHREEIMRDVCEDFGAELREFNGETDHVHLLVHYPPKVSIPRLVGSLKGVSARLLRRSPAASTGPSCTGTSGPVPLRRLLRRCTPVDHQGVHREPETAGPRYRSDAAALRAAPVRMRFISRLKPRGFSQEIAQNGADPRPDVL